MSVLTPSSSGAAENNNLANGAAQQDAGAAQLAAGTGQLKGYPGANNDPSQGTGAATLAPGLQ